MQAETGYLKTYNNSLLITIIPGTVYNSTLSPTGNPNTHNSTSLSPIPKIKIRGIYTAVAINITITMIQVAIMDLKLKPATDPHQLIPLTTTEE